MDHVVVRTATTLGTVVLTAVLSRLLLPVDEANISRSYGLATGAALVAFVLAMIQSVRRTPSPALILGCAAFEGVFLGVLHHGHDLHRCRCGRTGGPRHLRGVRGCARRLPDALDTCDPQVRRVRRRRGDRLRPAAPRRPPLLGLRRGGGLGFHSGGFGVTFGLVGILLGAAFLALDFKQVEDAVAYGAPREEAWPAAFGLSTTLVWIYLEVLRVLSLFSSDS